MDDDPPEPVEERREGEGPADDETRSALTVPLDMGAMGGVESGRRASLGPSLVNASVVQRDTDVFQLGDLDAELARIERLVGGHAGVASLSDPASASASAASSLVVTPALLAHGLESALATLHDSARTAMTAAVDAALVADPDAVPAASPADALPALVALLAEARAAAVPPAATLASDEAIARTYASLHPAARNLLRAVGDIRAHAAEYAAAFAKEAGAARLATSLRTWESARWTTEDAYRQTRDLVARKAAWQRALDAGMEAQWEDVRARATTTAQTWAAVAAKYAAALKLACDVDVHDDVAVMPARTAKQDAVMAAAAAVEGVRRAVQRFLDTWPEHDTAVRSRCLDLPKDGGAKPVDTARMQAAVATLEAQAARIEAAIGAARRRIVDAQKAQLADLLGGHTQLEGGMALAASLAEGAALQTAADAELDALETERAQTKAALAKAREAAEAAWAAARGRAARLLLKTHDRWREAALKVIADVETLSTGLALLRVHRTHLLQALDAEVEGEHERILAAGRAAYTAAVEQGAIALDDRLGTLGTQQAAVFAPLEASQAVITHELHALMASTAAVSGEGGVPGLAVGMPEPGVRLVDGALAAAARQRLAATTVELLHEHAEALQSVADGLGAGLAQPVPAPPPSA